MAFCFFSCVQFDKTGSRKHHLILNLFSWLETLALEQQLSPICLGHVSRLFGAFRDYPLPCFSLCTCLLIELCLWRSISLAIRSSRHPWFTISKQDHVGKTSWRAWRWCMSALSRTEQGSLAGEVIAALGVVGPATDDFAATKFPVEGLKEKFNAVAFYLPLQLMSTQSKQGSSNMPVRFRYTRLSS